jgi:hypothetical protein
MLKIAEGFWIIITYVGQFVWEWVNPQCSNLFSVILKFDTHRSLSAWVSITKYQSLGALNNKHCFLPVQETESPESAASKVGSWWGLSFWFADSLLLSGYSHGSSSVHARTENSGVFSSSYETLVLLDSVSTPKYIYLRALPPNTWGLRIQHMNLGGYISHLSL